MAPQTYMSHGVKSGDLEGQVPRLAYRCVMCYSDIFTPPDESKEANILARGLNWRNLYEVDAQGT
jgi:hypothetical protein